MGQVSNILFVVLFHVIVFNSIVFAPLPPYMQTKYYSSLTTQWNGDSTKENKRESDSADSLVNKRIRKIFLTNFGPGLHLFENTVPYANRVYFNSNNNQMLNDQKDSHNFEQADFLYNKDFVQKVEEYTNKEKSSSNKGNGYQNDFFNKRPSKEDGSLTAQARVVDSPQHKKNNKKHSLSSEEPIKLKERNEVNISECLEGDHFKGAKVFCNRFRNYPDKNRMESLIKRKFSNFETFFGEDLVLPQNTSERMNNAPNEKFLCQSRIRVIFPELGLNKDNNWLQIVNSPNYKQGIRIEECVKPGAMCGEDTGPILHSGLAATCEQNYIFRSLVAYTNETIIKDTFKIPSCCKCVLKLY